MDTLSSRPRYCLSALSPNTSFLCFPLSVFDILPVLASFPPVEAGGISTRIKVGALVTVAEAETGSAGRKSHPRPSRQTAQRRLQNPPRRASPGLEDGRVRSRRLPRRRQRLLAVVRAEGFVRTVEPWHSSPPKVGLPSKIPPLSSCLTA